MGLSYLKNHLAQKVSGSILSIATRAASEKVVQSSQCLGKTLAPSSETDLPDLEKITPTLDKIETVEPQRITVAQSTQLSDLEQAELLKSTQARFTQFKAIQLSKSEEKHLLHQNIRLYHQAPIRLTLLDDLIHYYHTNSLDAYPIRQVKHDAVLEVLSQGRSYPEVLTIFSLCLEKIGTNKILFIGIDECVQEQLNYIDSILEAENWRTKTDNLKVLRAQVQNFLLSPNASAEETITLLALLIEISQQLSLAQYLTNNSVYEHYEEVLKIQAILLPNRFEDHLLPDWRATTLLSYQNNQLKFLRIQEYQEQKKSASLVWAFDQDANFIDQFHYRFTVVYPNSLGINLYSNHKKFFITQKAFSIEAINSIQYTPLSLFGLSNQAVVFHDEDMYSITEFFFHDGTHDRLSIKYLDKINSVFSYRLKQRLYQKVSTQFHPLIELLDFYQWHEIYKTPWIGILNQDLITSEDIERLLKRLDRPLIFKTFLCNSPNLFERLLWVMNTFRPQDLPKDMLRLCEDKAMQKAFIRELHQKLLPCINEALKTVMGE